MEKAPRLVFLDASTVQLGDVDEGALKKLGSYRTFDDCRPSEILQKARGASILITNKCEMNRVVLEGLPALKLLCVAATGVNNVDLEAARARGVAVCNVKGYSTTTVAEHAILFLLALSHRLLKHHEASVGGGWSRARHFGVLDFPFSDLSGKTLGLVGYGVIGRRVAQLARAFGMKVMVAEIPGRRYAGAGRFPLAAVLRHSDFVSLHCPLSDLTKNLINKKTLACMKPTACLLNLSRGAIVDENAVADALSRRQIRAYAADVLRREPPPRHHPLFAKKLRDRVLLTPHVAWASVESRQRLLDEIALNIRAFLNGKKRNRVV